MNDITDQEAIEILRNEQESCDCESKGFQAFDIAIDSIRKQQKLRDEIKSMKKTVSSENKDYLTGYTCALSAVEGII